MRSELKNFDWHTYGLDLDDFDYTLELIKKLIDSQNFWFEKENKKLELKYKDEPEIFDNDFNDILECGKLRNALAHFPPEKYRPGLINEDDVKEYVALVKKVLSYLIEQKK